MGQLYIQWGQAGQQKREGTLMLLLLLLLLLWLCVVLMRALLLLVAGPAMPHPCWCRQIITTALLLLLLSAVAPGLTLVMFMRPFMARYMSK
jgi:hypothetical protein